MAAGAARGGSISAVQNLAAVCKGEKELDEALIDTAKTAGKSAIVGYGTGITTAALGGALQNSKNVLLKNLGKGAGPVALFHAGRILAGNVVKLAQGKISREQFVLSMTQESTALASSMHGAGVGATLGSAILPGLGTVAGGVIGGLTASMLTNAMFLGSYSRLWPKAGYLSSSASLFVNIAKNSRNAHTARI